MKLLIFAILACQSSLTAWAGAAVERLNKNGVALCEERDSSDDSSCYDPVSYFLDQKAQKVSAESAKKFREKFQNSTYVFSSQAHLDLFRKNPSGYLPQFGGWCAYAVASYSGKVDVDPRSFHIQDGRLLLFYDGFLSDTRKTWLNDKNKSPGTYLKNADSNWPSAQGKEP